MKQYLRAVVFGCLFLNLPAFAEAAGTGNIFVSNEKSDDIYVFSPEFDLIKKIETSERPRDMKLNLDGTLLYVTCGDEDKIDVIDVEALEVIRSISTGVSPEVFDFSVDGNRIFISSEEDSVLEVIDIASGKKEMEVPVGGEPEGVIAAPDGQTVYVTSEVADMVHVIDIQKGEIVKNIIVGSRPRRFEITPDDSELWVSNELSSEIHVIDRSTHEVKDILEFIPPGFRAEDVTPVGMAMTVDGSRAVVSLGRANHVAVIDTGSKEVLGYVLVGKRAWSADITADDKFAVVANGLSDDITLVDLELLKPIRSIPAGRVPHTVVIDD